VAFLAFLALPFLLLFCLLHAMPFWFFFEVHHSLAFAFIHTLLCVLPETIPAPLLLPFPMFPFLEARNNEFKPVPSSECLDHSVSAEEGYIVTKFTR
jgi:hypothetical protein